MGLRAEQHPQEKTWLTLKVLRKRSGAPGGEKEAVAQKKDGVLSGANPGANNDLPRDAVSAAPCWGRLVKALKRSPRIYERIMANAHHADFRQPLRQRG